LEQPGYVIAIAHRDQIVLERSFGHADLAKGTLPTARHRFRVASHSKSFTAAGILKLREAGNLKLDDPVGQYVPDLNCFVAQTTIAQLLSHSAGISRDGKDSGQFADRRPVLKKDELLADLKAPPIIVPNTRFKTQYALTLSVLTDAIDGFAQQWHDGIIEILRTFAHYGAQSSGLEWTLVEHLAHNFESFLGCE
jgi:CubicO group peptidase (beta-lactamase class C family)